MSDLFLTYLFASVSLFVSLFAAALLFRHGKSNENTGSEFNQIFTCFFSLTFTAFFLSDPYFSSGGYGIFKDNFSNLSDIKQLTLVIIFIGTFLVSFFSLVFGPLLVCDLKQWLKSLMKKQTEEKISVKNL